MLSVWSPSFMLDLLDAMGEPDLPALWPDLALISCWTEAGAARDAAELRARLPHAQLQGKGLMATKGVVTVPNAQGQCVLAQRGFFEFLHEGQLHSPQALQHRLDYEVVMTTASGLYRYRTGDLVRPECLGRAQLAACVPSCGACVIGHAIANALASPANAAGLRFMGRSGIQSDLVGEKLCEAFVSACLQGVPGACFLVPDAAARRYVLVARTSHQRRAAAGGGARAVRQPALRLRAQQGSCANCGRGTSPFAARLAQATLANGGRLADTKTLGLRVHDAARWLVMWQLPQKSGGKCAILGSQSAWRAVASDCQRSTGNGMKIALISPKGPLYRARGGIFKKSLRYQPGLDHWPRSFRPSWMLKCSCSTKAWRPSPSSWTWTWWA